MAAGVLLTSVRVEYKGLTLRSPIDDDIAAFMAVYDDDFDLRPQPRAAMDRVKVPDAILQRVKRHRQPQDRDNWRLELLVETEPGAVLGWALLEPDNDFDQLRVESSSWVAPPHRRKKNGTAIRHSLLALAFAGLHADVALSRAQLGSGSNSISENLGYVRGETTYTSHGRRVAYQNWSLARQVWEQMARPNDVIIGGGEAWRGQRAEADRHRARYLSSQLHGRPTKRNRPQAPTRRPTLIVAAGGAAAREGGWP